MGSSVCTRCEFEETPGAVYPTHVAIALAASSCFFGQEFAAGDGRDEEEARESERATNPRPGAAPIDPRDHTTR